MRTLLAIALRVTCALLAGAASAAAAEPVAVYGLELEVDAEHERLLIFAEAPLEPRLIEVDPRTLMVALPGAVLDASAPTRIAPVARGTVERVTAFDRAVEGEGPPEVRVVVQRRPGRPPTLERRASIVALDFEARPRVRESAGARSVRVAYRNTPLSRIVTDLARATGETLIFDDSLRGNVTIEGPDYVSEGEARALLDTVLLLRDLAAVPAPGGGRKIVSIAGAPSPWSPEGDLPDGDASVTTLLRLETVRAEDLVEVIRPLVGSQMLAQAYAPTNSLILSGPSSRLSRLRTAIRLLDDLDPGRSVLWRLRFANAGDVADQLGEILGRDVVYEATGDERTNRLLLRIREDAIERARELVRRLDRPAHDSGVLQVVRLEHADPESVAERLEALRGGSSSARLPFLAGLRGRDFAVSVDRATHSLVVRAAPEDFRAVLDVVDELDRESARVRVEVTVAEVTLDSAFDLGFDWLLPVTNPRDTNDLVAALISSGPGGIQTQASQALPFVASFTRSPILVTLVDALGNPVFLPGTTTPIVLQVPRESASLTLNDREVKSEVLMRPQLVVVSGEEQELFAGDNIPVIEAQAETGPSLETRQNIQRQDIGTTLRLRPSVGQQGGVFLDLQLEVSRVAESAAGDVATVGPSFEELSVQSKLWLDHDEVAVIATSTEPQTQQVVTGVPWVKDIPFLGWAFRRTEERSTRRYLLVSAQAEIVRPEREALGHSLAEQLTRVAPEPRSARRGEDPPRPIPAEAPGGPLL